MYLEKDGAAVFSRDAWICEEHEKMLQEDYFPIVGQIKRNPRYTNKRIMDPQLKCFVDEQGIEVPPEWGLPVPNAEASYKSLAKYGKNILPMSEDMVADMNQAWTYTERQFGLYMNNARVLTFEEAKGHLDMSTSTGAPFNQHFKTKAELFEKDENIGEWMEEDWQRLGKDPMWTCLATNSLKEELRTAEKIEENSIRTFLSVGVDGTVHGTRLFVDMNEKMYASHLQTASAVGMSPLKGKWDQLYRKLKTFRLGYALDESQYDSSLRAYLMWGCARFRWNMLRDVDKTIENLQRIRTYYRNLVNTLVVCPDGVIVMKKTGNPSGSVNTITDNTLILYTLLAYAWIRTVKSSLRSYEKFEMHTAKALVGDDNTWTVSDKAHQYYNGRSVIDVWKTLGVITTTDSLEPRKPEDLDFLSAHTVFVDGKALPLYSRVKLMNSLLFAPKAHITPATTLERTAAMLSIGWTDIPFRKFCREVIDWLLIRYDVVLNDEPRWIMAKCQIQTDERYYRLFMGERMLTFSPQSFNLSGEFVKLIQPDNNTMNRVTPKRNGTKPGKKTRKTNRGTKGPRGARIVQVTPKQAVARTRRRPRARKARGGNMLSAQGSSRTGLRSRRMCPVEEDEFIAAVVGSVGFANTAYPINPGNSTTFPWLAQEAKQWEKYHFEFLEFYYKRDVSEFATNGTTGKVILGVNFDASDPPPANKQQIEDSDPRVDGMPCESIRLPLNVRDMHSLYPTLYVRPGGLPGASDIKTYDAGVLNVATQGNQNTTEIGELRVRYRVIFSVPILESATTAPQNYSVFYNNSSTGLSLTTAVAGTLLFVGAPQANGLGAINANGLITLAAGNYLVDATGTFLFGGSATAGTTNICKNGAAVSAVGPNEAWTATTRTIVSQSQSAYVSLNGTDTISLQMTGTFSTSTGNAYGSLRITAI